MKRRRLLHAAMTAGVAAVGSGLWLPRRARAATASDPGFGFADVTAASGITCVHHSGARGEKLLPETLGSGCAFFDYDADGWPDILFVNGTDWPGEANPIASTLHLYRNNRDGTFTDVTRAAGLAVSLPGMGVAVGDFDNDGFPDLYITCVGQSRLFRNNGRGAFTDVTVASGLGGRSAFSTSAMWVDVDGDGHLDLFVCNYVKWAREHDVFCSLDGTHKSYCTPEAYRGDTCWLFRNRGDGTFEDVTATSGIFDSSSKSLGVALLDHDADGRPDLLVANDTQPNKLYRNLGAGRFREMALEAGVAFSDDGKARAGMGVAVGDFDNTGRDGIAITNFEGEMLGLYRAGDAGIYRDVALTAGVGAATRQRLGFGCLFADFDLDGALDLVVANGHIDETVRNIAGNVGHAQPPQLFRNRRDGTFVDVSGLVGGAFATPRVARGLACADFDRDGDVDVLLTTNNGPPVLLRNDGRHANRSLRLRLIGTRSNRDAIGARVVVDADGIMQSRRVHGASSYLSQSELPLTFGLGSRDRVERIVLQWPSGRVEEYANLRSGVAYDCTEGKGITPGK